MKKMLIVSAMVIGLLVSPLTTFAGEFKSLPIKFEGGNICNIPADWKLVSVGETNRTKGYYSFNLWFQDKEGNVYLVKIDPDPKTTQPIVQEVVYKIGSKSK
jgi:hypothetical protein